MELNPTVCYRAVQARDARYDGRFFTCVRTTGIYCRPICPARPPKAVNCFFVPTAAAAQAAGYRPCLRCRPESSPALDAWRGTEATVSRALKLIEGGALDEGDVGELADRLGIGARQLRRLFVQHLGAAPISVAQTRRVLLAKQLLHQTKLPMIDVALASGFGSVRRFNETFQRMYGRPPSELRRGTTVRAPEPEITILLPYRRPFDWRAMLGFLAARAIRGVEVVTKDAYCRLVEIDGAVGSVRVAHAPRQSSLQATVRVSRLDALPAVISRIRRQFDLGAEPNSIAAALTRDPLLAPLVAQRPGLRVPGAWDGFEAAVRAVLGQQISVSAAKQLARRLVETLGEPAAEHTGDSGLTHRFPWPERFSATALAGLGVPRARAACLVGLAEAALADQRLFDPQRDLTDSVARLRELPGVGEWTAQYIAMRALGESDAFLAADVGLRRALQRRGASLSPRQLEARAENWRPWRAYALMHLWMDDAAAASRSVAKEKRHALTA